MLISEDSDLSNYTFGPVLGVCNNDIGKIRLARNKNTNVFVCLKKYRIDEKEFQEFHFIEQEILLTRQLQHPNVLLYLNAFVANFSIYVVSPLMSYGSCSSLIEQKFKEGFPELAIALILKDVLQGLSYIHKSGIIHRAIRASHILISKSGQACLSGLRYSCNTVQGGKRHNKIYSLPEESDKNLKWLSPEILKQDLHGYNEKSDIYSLGMTICELGNGQVPFSDVTEIYMLTEKVKGYVPHIIDCTTYSFEEDNLNESTMEDEITNGALHNSGKYNEHLSTRKFSNSFHRMTALCLQNEPNHRPNADELSSHSFFKQCKKTDSNLLSILEALEPIEDSFTEELENESTQNSVCSDSDAENYEWDFECVESV